MRRDLRTRRWDVSDREVRLELTAQQAATLLGVIDGELGEFTSEIANTDNASYRASLVNRRDVIREVRAALEESMRAVVGN
jgi:hypothetical protein